MTCQHNPLNIVNFIFVPYNLQSVTADQYKVLLAGGKIRTKTVRGANVECSVDAMRVKIRYLGKNVKP